MSGHDIACPECGAPAGEPCTDRPSNAVEATWSHLGRNQAWALKHPKCTSSCSSYRVGYTEQGQTFDGTPYRAKHPPACEHPSRPAGGLDVVKGEQREDCPLRVVRA
jgi:hypothetical protein